MATDIFSTDRGGDCRDGNRGVIISPGALGDGLLMLPLAKFMKESLPLGRMDFIGHADYLHFYPGRTCIDRVRSIDSIEFHRLFVSEHQFELADKDRLIHSFSQYQWIVSFLGAGNRDFEDNLIFTVNCGHSAEIIMLPLMPDADFDGHISEFYIRKFLAVTDQSHQETRQAGRWPHESLLNETQASIVPTADDIDEGRVLLDTLGIAGTEKLAVIHPGSGGEHKCWHVENFCMLAEHLDKEDFSVVFILGPAEKRFDDAQLARFNSAGRCICDVKAGQMVQLIACSSLFVGNDSGPTHLAAGLGAATIAIFGPTDPAIYRPIGPRVGLLVEKGHCFTGPCEESAARTIEMAGKLLGD